MPNPKVILFNGPPQSGKDFAANYLHIRFLDEFPNKPVKFASRLKQITAEILGCNYIDFESSDFKNAKVMEGQLTNRQALIKVSDVIKEIYGERIFGTWLAKDNREYIHQENNILVSDSGFWEEFDGFREYFMSNSPNYEFHIVEIHGRGDFTNDSRGYIGTRAVNNAVTKNVFKHKIYNTGTASEFLSEVERIAEGILKN